MKMRWILGAFFGLLIAFYIYGLIGALCNLLLGPLLGYKVLKCSFFGISIVNINGKRKFEMGEFKVIPEVYLDANVKSRAKKLILDVFPVLLGFGEGMLLTWLFGGVRGVWRHILIGTLSGMSVLYCWHIFIALKMYVYMKENRKK